MTTFRPDDVGAKPPVRHCVATASPWNWRIDSASWARRLPPLLRPELFPEDLEVDRDALHDVLGAAAKNGEDWLFHPCLAPLLRQDRSLRASMQLLAWVSVNTNRALGTVRLREPVWIWQHVGGRTLQPGRMPLLDIGREMLPRAGDPAFALDVWLDSPALAGVSGIGVEPEKLWLHPMPGDDAPDSTLVPDLVRCMKALHVVQARLPAAWAWLASATKVIVPLRGGAGAAFNSSSHPDLPGLVFADMRNDAEIMEGLVHETAHHYFRLAEAEAETGFIAGDDPAIHPSPLRQDARPLRGVFLAFHALAYICALFSDLLTDGTNDAGRQELENLRAQCRAARNTIEQAQSSLTSAGREFFLKTVDVADYGS